MTAEPIRPGADEYDVIHLGGQSAVVVPMADFLRLRALEQTASQEALEDAEDLAAFQDWEAREAVGATSYLTMDDVRRLLDLER